MSLTSLLENNMYALLIAHAKELDLYEATVLKMVFGFWSDLYIQTLLY